MIIQFTGCVDDGCFVVDEGNTLGVGPELVCENVVTGGPGVGSQAEPVFKDVVTSDPGAVRGQPPASVVA